MISVSRLENRQGICGFRCEGHADYAAEGEADVICAAVTALAATVVSAVTDILKLAVEKTFSEGLIEFCLADFCQAQDKGVKLLFETFELGVRQIEMSYGSEYVHVEDMPIKL